MPGIEEGSAFNDLPSVTLTPIYVLNGSVQDPYAVIFGHFNTGVDLVIQGSADQGTTWYSVDGVVGTQNADFCPNPQTMVKYVGPVPRWCRVCIYVPGANPASGILSVNIRGRV